VGVRLAPAGRSVAESRRVIDIAPAAIVKILIGGGVVWLWLRLWPILMVLLVAIVLAIALEPAVRWFAERRVPLALAAALLVGALAGIVVGFFYLAGTSLAGQAHELSGRLSAFTTQALAALPTWLSSAIRHNTSAVPDAGTVAGYVLVAGRLVLEGAVVAVLALILTVYLLVEGGRTYAWVAAYAPPALRQRVHVTAREARRAIHGYIVGNVVTSLFATGFVFVVLSLLKVPAALLLALLAGVFDFVPVLGFIVSSVPAVLLAISVSPGVALIVAILYVGYHLAENYYIAPKIYGDELRLSNLAVVLAFAAGAAIAGVVGAILALPIAALYPVIESVWLREYLGREAVETHRRIERQPPSSAA
jgi:predicted PurR-regulated permease PerM